MFYKHNSFNGRLAGSEAIATYHPEGFNTLKAPSSVPAVEPLSSGKGGAFEKLSQIVKEQKMFQMGDAPVHLKRGAKDLLTYRGAMIFSVIGLSITFFSLAQMALGKMKKK